MGLKNTNYTAEGTKILLPEAYAILTNLIIEKDCSARAIFAIQANREYAETLDPVDKHEVRFVWDRKTDPSVMAYEVAKAEKHEVEDYNEETGEIYTKIVYGKLYNWDNAIQKVEE